MQGVHVSPAGARKSAKWRQNQGFQWKLLRLMAAAQRVQGCTCTWENRHSLMALIVGPCHAQSEVFTRARQYRI